MQASWRAFLIGGLAGFLAVGVWHGLAHRKTPLKAEGLRQLEAQSLELRRQRRQEPFMPVSVGSPVTPPSLDGLIDCPASLEELLGMGDQIWSPQAQLRMYASLEGVTQASLRDWFERLTTMTRSGTSAHTSTVHQALRAVVERWVEADPLSALQRASEIPAHLSADPLLLSIANLHPTRVGELLDQVSLDETKRLTLMSWLITAWKGDTAAETAKLHQAFLEAHASEDERRNFLGSPQSTKPGTLAEAEARVANASHPRHREDLWEVFYSQIFDRSGSPHDWLEQAAAWKLDERDERIRKRFYERVAKDWLEQDPAAAIRWINELSRRERASVINQVINGKAQSHPELATALYDSLPPADRSAEALRNIMQYWGQLDPAAAAAWHQSHEAHKGLATPKDHLVAWIRSDLEAAMKHLQAHSQTLGDMDAYDRSIVFRELIDQNQATALLAMVQSSTEGGSSPGVINDFTQAWAEEHFEEAQAFAEHQVAPDIRRAALEGIASAGTLADYNSTLTWIENLPMEDQLGPMVVSLQSAHINPQEAARAATSWLAAMEDQPLPSREATRAIAAVSQHYARLAPQAAADWALELAHTDARQLSIDHVTKAWAATDPNALAQWLAHVPPSNERDRALNHLIGNIIDSPEAADAWTQEIQSESLRATWEDRLRNPQHAAVPTP